MPSAASTLDEAHGGESQRPPFSAEERQPADRATVLETLAIILIAFAAYILMSGDDAPSITARTLIGEAPIYLGWILLVARLLATDSEFSWNLPSTLKQWALEVGWGAVLFGAATLMSLGIHNFGYQWGIASHPTYWDQALRDPTTRLAFKVVAPLSAFQEEMLCRVYMQTRFTQILRGRPILVVVAASGLFAAVHGYAVLESLSVFGVGVVLGTSYQINHRIPRLVIAHAANNLLLP